VGVALGGEGGVLPGRSVFGWQRRSLKKELSDDQGSLEAAPSVESLLEKENGIKGVSRKISVDLICEKLEFDPRKLCLLIGSREVGQISTQAVGGHHPGRRRRDFSRVLPKTEGAIGPCNDIPIRWVLRIVGEELLQLKYFLEGGRGEVSGHT
jgi:hypothetical protein